MTVISEAITGLNAGEQSRLIQHGNTIESLQETLDTILKEDNPSLEQVNEYKHQIEDEKEKLRIFVEQLKSDVGIADTNEWVDTVLKYIAIVEENISFLPDDIEKVIRFILTQAKKVLVIIRDL